ncbi:sulfite exporter TauE/SafE family protein [Sedimentitalea sp. JM2-8]|uniref:Probable membrane transporter protein n=1 Tax=Sedimentitalea xiamensis TaxID=3050037 RepID=A0ABT7FFY3_9RHOB|nr:sulfite exporter TauE/SafE family protein [Sedimentitalea xiamensis]MDK3074056.1 sulfite exporter TauE/SafE family protein [Sedimentitalea xiamensis]
MSHLLALPPGLTVLAILACFLAGAVRGFAGFGLSALAMAMLAAFIPPIQLIPAFWFLEMSASLILMKGGWADADRPAALILILSAGIGLPIGLSVSLSLDPTLSKTAALAVLIVLALMQVSRLRLPVLATRPGTVATGLSAGFITGIAGVGGMLIALYALARDIPARRMRGTLNIYLLGGGVIGLVVHLLIGTMTAQAATRGLALILPTLAGVFVGQALFTPRWERWYRPACLFLLIGLAASGLLRLVLAQ